MTRNLWLDIVITHIKLFLGKLSLSHDSYNGHSFRIGAATSVYEARLEDHIIQTRYSHTSPKVIQHA